MSNRPSDKKGSALEASLKPADPSVSQKNLEEASEMQPPLIMVVNKALRERFLGLTDPLLMLPGMQQ